MGQRKHHFFSGYEFNWESATADGFRWDSGYWDAIRYANDKKWRYSAWVGFDVRRIIGTPYVYFVR